jgi:hypothetical protein
LKAAETAGMGLSAYAAQHDINVRRLYEERHYAARAKAARAKAARARQRRSAFVPVKVKPQAMVKVAPVAHHRDAPGARTTRNCCPGVSRYRHSDRRPGG